jgi:hypothetical protein
MQILKEFDKSFDSNEAAMIIVECYQCQMSMIAASPTCMTDGTYLYCRECAGADVDRDDEINDLSEFDRDGFFNDDAPSPHDDTYAEGDE